MWEDNSIEAALSLPEKGSLLIITVGNSMRGDDGAGPYIAERLNISSERVTVFDTGMNPENSMDVCEHIHPAKVVFIDAANWDGEVGDTRMISEELIPSQTISTHMFPLSTIGALIQQDENCEVLYLGIQLGTANLGQEMSVEVRASADKIISYLQNTYSSLQ